MVLSGVAERMAAAPGAIGALVFLDAFVPADGESVADLASPAVREAIAGPCRTGRTDHAAGSRRQRSAQTTRTEPGWTRSARRSRSRRSPTASR
jgi:hypothetical protein